MPGTQLSVEYPSKGRSVLFSRTVRTKLQIPRAGVCIEPCHRPSTGAKGSGRAAGGGVTAEITPGITGAASATGTGATTGAGEGLPAVAGDTVRPRATTSTTGAVS